MKKKTLRALLLTSILGATVFTVVLPSSIPDLAFVPAKPIFTETPSGEDDINPLVDIEDKKSQ